MIIPQLEEWRQCPSCNGSGVKIISKGKNKGKAVICPHCKGKGGWMIPFGLAVVGIILLIIFI